jgi:hypothetical protein
MNRRFTVAAFLVVAVSLFGALFARAAAAKGSESPSTLTISPGQMKDGETRTLIDNGRKVTIRKSGDSLNVVIEGAGRTRNVVITESGNSDVVIGSDGDRDGERHVEVFGGPGHRQIIIDGRRIVPGEAFNSIMPAVPGQRMQSWFVCPKDHTMLRVPADHEDGTFKCPVDGTTMEKRKGRGFAYFFDDDTLDVGTL